jgi:hypothetical protein
LIVVCHRTFFYSVPVIKSHAGTSGSERFTARPERTGAPAPPESVSHFEDIPMFDPKQLLNQVLGGGNVPGGPGGLGGLGGLGQQVRGRLDSMGGTGGFAGGAAVGGLLGMLLGGRRRGGGLLSYGTAAAVGALALHAYQA